MTDLARIWEPKAYGPSPIRDCWWADTVAPGDWPALDGDTTTDVAIVGAGFTGLSAALHLAEAGVGVTVLDAQHPFWGASGRNGGFNCLGGAKASHDEIAKKFGQSEMLDYARAERAAVETVGRLVDRLDLDVDRHSDGETMLAHRPKDFEHMRKRAGQIKELYGVEPTIIPPEELAQSGLNGPFHGAVTNPLGFALNPRKYARGLAHAARDAGAAIHGHSAVTGIEPRADGYRLHTASGTVRAKKFIIATNGYSSDNLPSWMASRYPGLSHTDATEATIQKKIRADFDAMFPAWRHVETPHYWSGFVCISRDLLPYAGPIPGMEGGFAAFAYHGNGVSMGSYSGTILADLVQGRTPSTPYPAPMSHTPRRFPLGRFRRLLMRPAYLQYALHDL
ncbi:FAD-binding oxidoreductase [Roseovarius sp.]|uniref:NAD(P)/FAD-dependent oxidoreductase n=1 Tax=Roseovarius sp. TaxID=1486281 RepID=UPI00261A0FDE|nr:FAD-binding oxidoreductase [Roseovarius sp.]MDM8166084.1 FAD-binding oxidoreductase [Roseovarius sp.]